MVVNGQAANATTFNGAFVSKTADSEMAGILTLANSSTATVTDVQGTINSIFSDISGIDSRVTVLESAETVATHIADTTPHATISGTSLQSPTRLDFKKDTEANLTTYAATAANGEAAFATDTKEYYGIVDGALVAMGGGGGITEWATSTDYEVGDVIHYNNSIYKAVSLHTSGTFNTDIASGYWQFLSALYADGNYITNGKFFVNATGWATYADAAGAVPVDGTGGSATSTFARNTTTPLIGLADGLFSKDAANRQGEGFSYDFTIDPAKRASMLTLSFDYSVSANYVDGDIGVFLYDVTNSRLIYPADQRLMASSLASKATYQFQTSADSVSYRVIFHVTSTNASAWTMNIANVFFGEKAVTKGAPVTDWVAYTPTFNGFGTPTGVDYRWKREGGDILIKGYAVSGTTTAAEARIGLPSGLVIDSTRLTSLTVVGNGWFSWTATSPSTNHLAIVATGTGNPSYVNVAVVNSTTYGVVNANTIQNNAQGFSIEARVPIAGWSSNMTLSEDSGNRLIAFRAAKTSTQAVSSTSATKVTFTSVSSSDAGFDTTASFDTTNSRFVLPESGVFWLAATLDVSATDAGTGVLALMYKNGALFLRSDSSDASAVSGQVIVQGVVNGNRGDYFEIYVQSKGGDASYNVVGNAGFDEQSSFYGYKLSSPQTIAQSERVYGFYKDNSAQTLTSGSTITWNTKIADSHNLMSSGTITVNKNGVMNINSVISTSAVSGTIGQFFQLVIHINGANYIEGAWDICQDTTSRRYKASVTGVSIPVSRGDLVTIRPSYNIPSVTAQNDGRTCYISWEIE